MFENDTNYLDQHFLIDEEIINKYLSYPHFTKNDVVLEIGPGKGTLTKLIAPKVGKLYCVELDTRLKPYLKTIPNIDIIWGNILDVEIPKINKIITSLPYSIIEPFIYKMIRTDFDELYMLMGSNFILNTINKKISKLSVITNAFFKVELLLEVPPASFDIPPRVDSYIVKMTKKLPDDRKYKIYRELFFLDDKKIKNGLMEALIKIDNITKRQAKAKIISLNIPEAILENKFSVLSNEDLQTLDKILELS